MEADTTSELAELERLAVRATARPWYARGQMLSRHPDGKGVGGGLHTNHIANFADRDDAALVAALVNAMPALVDRVRRADERIAELEANLLDYWAQFGAVAHVAEPPTVTALKARIADLERERDEALAREKRLHEALAESGSMGEAVGRERERADVVDALRTSMSDDVHWWADRIERGEHVGAAGGKDSA